MNVGPNVVLCMVSIALIPFALAGLALIHQGLGRSRSAAHAMAATLCAVAVAAIVFALVGAGLAGFAGGPARVLVLGGIEWDGMGSVWTGWSARPGGLFPELVLGLEIFAAGMAALIPLSTGNDRWRLAGIALSTTMLAGLVLPLAAHWVWGGGWLGQFPAQVGLPGLVDVGGAGVVQAMGGMAALSAAWVLGARQGKYHEGMATAIPGHNIVQVLFGCLLALVGWMGLEMAGSVLFYRATPEQVGMLLVNAVLAAGAGSLAAMATTRLRYHKVDASLTANGWVAGLVAGSAAAGMASAQAAIVTGLVAGALVTFVAELLELKLLVDDPGGAISVHGVSGLWGLLACGLFRSAAAPRAEVVLAQLIGIATLVGVFLPLIHGVNLLLNRLVRYRVDGDGDWQGMDVRELGAGAYPEFAMHADDFAPR